MFECDHFSFRLIAIGQKHVSQNEGGGRGVGGIDFSPGTRSASYTWNIKNTEASQIY